MHSTVSARVIRPFLALPPQALARFDLSALDLDDPEARVDYMTLVGLLELTQRLTGQTDGGLKGALLEGATLNVFEYMTRSSLTARDALDRTVRYQAILHEAADFRVEHGEHESVMVLDIKHGLPFPSAVVEFFMGSLFRALRRLGVPASGSVSFTHAAPRETAPYAAFFGVPVQFGAARNCAVFPSASLVEPLPDADPALAATLERHAAQMLSRMPRGTPHADQLRALLVDALPGGAPTLLEAARRARSSPRTLRRRLADEGQSFQSLLDELRRELALHYLAAPDMDAERAAFLLGFAEASSFRRAFKRWTGQTVAEHQKRVAPRSSTASAEPSVGTSSADTRHAHPS
jgi:AraC-like DNA-binding protein